MMMIAVGFSPTVICYKEARAELTCSNQVMCISTRREGTTTHFTAINKMPHLPVTFSIRLDLKNLKIVDQSKMIFALQGGERKQIFSLKPSHRSRSWRYSFEYNWVYGDLNAVHDADQIYQLPFASGKSFRISQSCNGDFSHHGNEKFALDFKLPENTPVHAARSGKVAAIKQDSNRGGSSSRFKADANYVFIQHDDGTTGFYFHLAQNSAVVEPGARIEAGAMIARSGNTGFSSGPHLHFEVARVALTSTSDPGINALSIPVQFDTTSGPVICPATGTRVRKIN